MKKYFIATSLSLALMSSQSSIAMPPKPAKCPSVNSLQTTPLENAAPEENGTWVVGNLHNNYDTTDAWSFMMGKIVANSEQDALKEASESLKSLTHQSGPTAIEDFDLWVCDYNTAGGYPAVAMTSALDIDAAKNVIK